MSLLATELHMKPSTGSGFTRVSPVPSGEPRIAVQSNGPSLGVRPSLSNGFRFLSTDHSIQHLVDFMTSVRQLT